MLVIDSDASLVSATPGAAHVLAEFAIHGVDIDVPTVVMAAARRAENLKNADKVTHKTYRESLQNNQDIIRQSLELATIHCEVPVKLD